MKRAETAAVAPILEVELTDDNALACLARVERALVEEPEGADGHVPPFDLAAAVQGWRSIPDGVPEVFQAGLGRLLGMVDAEAPTGDRGLEAVAVSPEIYRAGVESWTSEGGHVVDAVALLDDGAGPEVVAFNRVVVPGTPAEPAAPDLSTGETRGFPPSLTVGPSVSAGSRMAGELEPATAGARRPPRRATCQGGALVAAPLRR